MDAEPQHVELYELLGVPTKIMAPRKTGSAGESPHSDGKTAQTLVLQHFTRKAAKVGLIVAASGAVGGAHGYYRPPFVVPSIRHDS